MYFHMHKIITSKKGSNEFEKNEVKCMERFEERKRGWRNVIIISKKQKYFILIWMYSFYFVYNFILY